MAVGAPEKHEFQAEVKQLLDIVVHSLYTDKDIFIRELVSNASDALEKFRHVQITEKEIYDANLDLEINITTDEKAKTVTIQDFGVGMTEAELVENLGTIAHSGSKAFLETMKKNGGTGEGLIGQFGVGFYSAFMVAEEVNVYAHSWREDAAGACWNSDGSGSYTIEGAEGQRRGCKVVVKLKDEHKEFAQESKVKSVLERYSSFVPFPVNLNGTRVNTVKALWLSGKNEIKEEEYKAFYKFQSHAFDEPLMWYHFNADVPLAINALLFVPSSNPESLGFGRIESKVALHCRKILIDEEPKGLLPEWLRFLKGVVDSEDLPLNISRESMQDSALLQKINRVITKRFLKHLEDVAKKDGEKYKTFWNTFGTFLKEGATTDFTHKEQIAKLLRFESSMCEKGTLTHLGDYVSRMKEDQNEIYYLIGPSRESIESGPYLEAFKARGLEVLFLYETIDDFVMNHLGEFEKKKLVSADQEDIKFEEIEANKGEALGEEEVKGLCAWLQEALGKEKVSKVSVGERLVESPALVLNADKMMSSSMRRIMKVMQQDEVGTPSMNLQINPRHGLIKNLAALRAKNEGLAKLVAAQLLDNARVSAGLLEDPREMVSRVYELLETVSSGA